MFRNQIDQVRRSSKSFNAIAEKKLREMHEAEDPAAEFIEKAILEETSLESLGAPPESHESQVLAEAIILAELRPAYFVRKEGIDLNNDVEGDLDLVDLIKTNIDRLNTVCNSVGRVDLLHHWTHNFGGTGFLVGDDLAVTNRHVANMFGEAVWNGFRFRRGRFGEQMEARLDYCHFHNSQDRKRAEVEEILYIAKDHEPDFALLKVKNLDDTAPLDLSQDNVQAGHPVAVIGYPASDGERNERDLMDELFGGVYEVKRFAPGFVTGRLDDKIVLLSDYSSLGGNSGSPVCSLETGNIVGLHFAGRFKENNYAIDADILDAARRQVRLVHESLALPPETPATGVEETRGRNGYDPDFLGSGDLRVDLPLLGSWAGDVARIKDTQDHELRYQNFSTIQSESRRLPLLTAVNIDGAKSKRLRRKGSWKLDARLADKHQIGNSLYRHNPLDRGHMVRRRDPGWGEQAQQAEIDTFHYTNCVPQHEDLNQRDWVGLEDYILEAAETLNFCATVFTGPVFGENDKRFKEQSGAKDIQIPEEFWKIAVIVNETTGVLSATGYVLSHGPFIRDLVESPFVFGSYKTYQVQIARIEAKTGLNFLTLANADPLGTEISSEAAFSQVAREIRGPDSLILK